jgi:3'-phosphoadenosine 5'-phosphosulfate sulfotransferase (PAPS reductase)/FAD synthetase
MTIRAFSFGGGQQSTAALVLAAEGKIDFPLFIFSNVGEEAENPATLDYVEKWAKPYAEANGIELIEVRKIRRGGEPDDLYKQIQRQQRSISFPVRMANGSPGNRTCTADFKMKVVDKELKRRGASAEDPAITGLGISTDEFQRAKTERDPRRPHILRHYPLIEMNLSRMDCQKIIRNAGLPVPPKSSCWFCPFQGLDQWRTLRRNQPELFAKAEELEKMLNERRKMLNRDNVWLTRFNRPIGEVVADQMVLELGDLDNCESGYCLT